jgi:hypothetical protein
MPAFPSRDAIFLVLSTACFLCTVLSVVPGMGGICFSLATTTGAAVTGYQVFYSHKDSLSKNGAMATAQALTGNNNAQLFLLCMFWKFRGNNPSFLALGPVAVPALVQSVKSLSKLPAMASKVAWLDAKLTANIVQVWAMAIQLEIGSLLMLLVRMDFLNLMILTRLLKARYHCGDAVVMRLKMSHPASFFHVQIWKQIGGYIDRVAVYVPPVRAALSAVSTWFTK